MKVIIFGEQNETMQLLSPQNYCRDDVHTCVKNHSQILRKITLADPGFGQGAGGPEIFAEILPT